MKDIFYDLTIGDSMKILIALIIIGIVAGALYPRFRK